MESSCFGLNIKNKRHDANGYVAMQHKEQYAVLLKNGSNRRAKVTLKIDGDVIDTFIVWPFTTATIERPTDAPKKFTFYRTGTEEYHEVEGFTVSKENRGLVQAIFELEVETIKPLVIAYNDVLRRGEKQSQAENDNRYKGSPESLEFSSNASSGVTGLSGHSDQTFTTVRDFETDHETMVEISLRLMTFSHDTSPEPLRKRRGNPVPHPLD